MSGSEATVEQSAIAWFRSLGYDHAPGFEVEAERGSHCAVVLEGRLRRVLGRLNQHLPAEALDEVARRVMRPSSRSLEESNVAFHRWLSTGVEVQLRRDGAVRGDLARLVDFEHPAANDWLVVSQLTVTEGKHRRRPDLVVYLNGLPIAVLELKSAEVASATVRSAWNQLQTYKRQIPSLFTFNELLVISDGTEARLGSMTAGFERFSRWRTINGVELAPASEPQLKVMILGVFSKALLLDYLRSFIFWETEDGHVKKIAGYHQMHAVNKAVEATVAASAEHGDRRIGVVWHTQGSGKSVTMTYFAGKIIRHRAMANPTLVVITDRNDLDGQLLAQFAAAQDLIPRPEQALSREHLRELLQVASGGVVFSTLQKFAMPNSARMPVLSERRNIVVIADEAHRSHYGFATGLAKNLREALPNASFIGFTGTPIELDDRSTPAVFGEYIDTYTIAQSVADGATVPLFYEARLAKIDLPDEAKPLIDEQFDAITEGEEEASRSKLKATWARLEAMVGSPRRLHQVAEDILAHFERRTSTIEGKAMIVCMSRRICVELNAQIIKLRPSWHADDDDSGAIKVVMTGSASDPLDFQPHIRSWQGKKLVEKRFKDPADPLRMVIVCDMWLTGFDVPCAHTLYLDKPIKGHTLMQAIARVNRVFGDKPGGLVVDYLGVAEHLRRAVGTYGGQHGETPGLPVEQALEMLREKVEIVRSMLHGFDASGSMSAEPATRLETLAAGADHVLGLDNGKKRFLDAMAALTRAAGIALHLEAARDLRDEVGFYQAIAKNLRKYATSGGSATREELNLAIRQIVSEAVASDGVIDIFAAAGLAKPDISILSDEFLQTLKTNPHRNLQIELLKKLLTDEITAQSRRNVVQSRRFSEMLERTLNLYNNRSLEAAEVILALIDLARQMRDAPKRGQSLGLSEDELAFYDALVAHGGVREVMGDATLAAIAHELVDVIRRSVTIDWTQKESVRARMRSMVKRLLRKRGYPPDKQDAAVVIVLEQAEQLCRDWDQVA